MATTPQPWSITLILMLGIHVCLGEKSCKIWSSAGSDPVVQRGSTFQVYCTFNCKCKRIMYETIHDTYEQQPVEVFNSTTLYRNVENITEDRTYSCKCNKCMPALDSCGLDITTGYPPEIPQNITCIQNVIDGEVGHVKCTWKSGRATELDDDPKLWVRENHIAVPVSYKGSNGESNLLSAVFKVSSSVQVISVWVNVSNQLGTAASTVFSFTLADIVRPSPPVLDKVACRSRDCLINVGQSNRTQHLQIQYQTEQGAWITHSDTSGQMNLLRVQSVSSLEPYRLYYFRARVKLSTGLWSQWSTSISNWTQEEGPNKELDVWLAESSSEMASTTVYWKKLDDVSAGGKIIRYLVKVHCLDTGLIVTKNLSADATNSSIQSCSKCNITVFACNSKGMSPPAIISMLQKTGQPPQDVRVKVSNRTVSISWTKPETTLRPDGYLVEWYPEGQQLRDLQWLKLSQNSHHAVITDVKPFHCYEGAVYALYKNSIGRARFSSVSTLESAPVSGPSVQEMVEGNVLTVTWTEVPNGQRGGCISNYTIKIKDTKDSKVRYSDPIPASKRMHTIKSLPPAAYSLSMTAWTSQGEGPDSEIVRFVIQAQSHTVLILCIVLPFLMVLCCLSQMSAMQQRFCVCFHRLMPDVVPDPANSKWAKECIAEKGKRGKITLQPQLSSSREEEEPIIVDIEELKRESSSSSSPGVTTQDVSSDLLQPSLSPGVKPATLLYPLTSYIKSFSHDSDSSDNTHSSQETSTTVDYISSHGLANEIEEEDEEFMDVQDFFPSHSAFMDPQVFLGNLTLDVVKIDCSNLLENT